MNRIFQTALLLVVGVLAFTSCSDDNGSNPTLKKPTTFVLNQPAVAGEVIDLSESESIKLTFSQPDYGFPASVRYYVQLADNEAMNDLVEVKQIYTNTEIDLPTTTIANLLTEYYVVEKEQTEADFPKDMPLYVRVRAIMVTANGNELENTQILSNVVKFDKIHLDYLLPPVELPTQLFAIGSYCENSWDGAVKFAQTNSNPQILWHMLWIDEKGIKLNDEQAQTDNVITYDKITVAGDKADEIVNNDGWIASNNPGWYLVIVNSAVEGRDILYTIEFNEPNVYLMGSCTPGGWTELQEDMVFEVPSTADGNFVSPAFIGAPTDDGGLRAYVKLAAGIEWWKSEFMLFNGKIEYRGAGGDQARITDVSAGQKLYLNFSKDTGEIK